LKLIEPCFISGGKPGNGWARRTIAKVSPSRAACPDDPASRLPSTEMPIGILTAAVGAPFFLAMLLRQRGLAGL
jgi:hypothetical protein